VFNIGRSYQKLDKYPEAYRYYYWAWREETDPVVKNDVWKALEAIQKNVALLDVEANVPEAQVFLDREDLGLRGTTPLRLALPVPRDHETVVGKLIVRKAGYETYVAEHPFVLGEVTQVVATLIPKGRLKLLSPSGARIDLDSPAMVEGPDGRLEPTESCMIPCNLRVTTGIHVLHVRKGGFKPLDLTLRVTQTEQRRELRLEPLTGGVEVASDEPGASVYVDLEREPRGITPLGLTLPVGEHVVGIEADGFRRVSRRVLVEEGKTWIEHITLVPVEEVEAATPIRWGTDDPLPLLYEEGFRRVQVTSFDEAALDLTGTYDRQRRWRFQSLVTARVAGNAA
jgi:hypothetical protein